MFHKVSGHQVFKIHKNLNLNHKNSMLIKIQPDATVCGYLSTAKSLYMYL